MSKKTNCWQFKNCGREKGGVKEKDLGVCTASVETKLDGIHGGKNSGRACWAVAGTLCGGQVQGSFATKHKSCENCEFYKAVREEEKSKFENILVILKKLK